MLITTIGTGCAVPSLERGSSCTLLCAGGLTVAIDLGLNSLRGLLGAGVAHREVDAVFLTHLHPDHIAELMPFLFAANYDEAPRLKPLLLAGSAETGAYFREFVGLNGKWLLAKGYEREFRVLAPGQAFSLGPLTVSAGGVNHEPSSLAYRFAHGEKSVVVTGDTGPSEALAHFAGGASLLVAEASLPEGFPLDIHLSASQAGELARKAGVGKLVLTHFYPSSEADYPGKRAAAAFGGEVVAARDGQEFEI